MNLDRIRKRRHQAYRIDHHRTLALDSPRPRRGRRIDGGLALGCHHPEFHVTQQPNHPHRTRRQTQWRTRRGLAPRITQLQLNPVGSTTVPRPLQLDRIVAGDQHRFAIEQEVPAANRQPVSTTHLDRTIEPTADRHAGIGVVEIDRVGKVDDRRIGQDHHRLALSRLWLSR